MNQLLVTYKGGHSRTLNLDKSFFNAEEPKGQNKFNKKRPMSSTEKAIDLANYLDPNPYTIELVRDGKSLAKHTYPQNNPNGTNERTN